MIKNQALGGRTTRALILLGLFLGLVSAALVVVYLSKASDDGGGNVSGGVGTPVVVASQDIPAGTRVTVEMLTLKPIASDAVLAGAYTEMENGVGPRPSGAGREGDPHESCGPRHRFSRCGDPAAGPGDPCGYAGRLSRGEQ